MRIPAGRRLPRHARRRRPGRRGPAHTPNGHGTRRGPDWVGDPGNCEKPRRSNTRQGNVPAIFPGRAVLATLQHLVGGRCVKESAGKRLRRPPLEQWPPRACLLIPAGCPASPDASTVAGRRTPANASERSRTDPDARPVRPDSSLSGRTLSDEFGQIRTARETIGNNAPTSSNALPWPREAAKADMPQWVTVTGQRLRSKREPRRETTCPRRRAGPMAPRQRF